MLSIKSHPYLALYAGRAHLGVGKGNNLVVSFRIIFRVAALYLRYTVRSRLRTNRGSDDFDSVVMIQCLAGNWKNYRSGLHLLVIILLWSYFLPNDICNDTFCHSTHLGNSPCVLMNSL